MSAEWKVEDWYSSRPSRHLRPFEKFKKAYEQILRQKKDWEFWVLKTCDSLSHFFKSNFLSQAT